MREISMIMGLILIVGVISLAIIDSITDCNNKDCKHGELHCQQVSYDKNHNLKFDDCECKICRSNPKG